MNFVERAIHEEARKVGLSLWYLHSEGRVMRCDREAAQACFRAVAATRKIAVSRIARAVKRDHTTILYHIKEGAK